MRVVVSDEEREFREQARSWLADNVPHEPRPLDRAASREYDRAWQKAQYDAGFAGINWPVEFGGRGLSIDMQMVWIEECFDANAPGPGCLVGALNHTMPTLIKHGTEAQLARHLQPVLEGDQVWCQGFSEPVAGSDLANLRTKAVIDGDDLVVTGQKIWTSYADLADYQALLVRTEPDAPKHRGISWVICDMHAPGVDVRPLRLMGGDNHFAEVFYDEVRIPLSNVVGERGDGWKIAMDTMSFERGTGFIPLQLKMRRTARDLVELARTSPSPSGRGTALDDGGIRAEIGRVITAADTLQSMTYQLVSRARSTGGVPGADSSLMRIYFSLTAQQIHALAQRIRGQRGLIDDTGDHASWTYEYLWSYQSSIGGGTREIQRNIVGDRVLNLPRV